MSGATDKAVIFLVEGDTDELSLGGIMHGAMSRFKAN